MISSLIFSVVSYAHPGNTDSNGGHYNHSTGEYHYHHGHSAHQHNGGRCPYDNWWIGIVVILVVVVCIVLYLGVKSKIEEIKNKPKRDKKSIVLKVKTIDENKRRNKTSDEEWEQLYKTDFEKFWHRVLEETDLRKLPTKVYNYRDDEAVYGKAAREMHLGRLKWIIKPSQADSQLDIDKRWKSLMELKCELEKKDSSVDMYDVIDTYHSRYVRY